MTPHDDEVAIFARGASRALQAYGITAAGYHALRVLRDGGPHGLMLLALRERMPEPCPPITRLMDKLEAGGYARRDWPAAHPHLVQCFVTPAGERVVELIETMARRAYDSAYRDAAGDAYTALAS